MDQDVGDKAAAARSPCVGADRSRAMGKVLARGGPWLEEIQVMLPALEIEEIEEIRSSAAAGFKPPCLAEAAAATIDGIERTAAATEGDREERRSLCGVVFLGACVGWGEVGWGGDEKNQRKNQSKKTGRKWGTIQPTRPLGIEIPSVIDE